MRVVMELNSALARVAFLEERLENSVPVEQYEAKAAECEAYKREKETISAQCMERLARKDAEHGQEIAAREKEISDLRQALKDSSEAQAALKSENMDFRKQMDFWRASHFTASSETMTEEMNRLVGRLPEEKASFITDTLAMINRINATHGNVHYRDADTEKGTSDPGDSTEGQQSDGQASDGQARKEKKPRRPWRKTIRCRDIRNIFNVDLSEMPFGSKVAFRKVKGKKREEVTEIEIIFCQPARFFSEIYKVANCNVPGVDGTRQSKRPKLLFLKVPVDPSFARFYLEMKFQYNRSEGQIVEYLHKLGCKVGQATLNRWMHAIMDGLMERLLPAMEDEIRLSRFTHNDETRILVRSFDKESDKDKYNTEYIHGIYSPSANLFLMLYKQGSRSHEVQMEIFEGSSIEAFIADRCPLYTALQKEYESPPIRGACWIHFRRYLLIAYRQDERLEPAVQLLARLFAAEKIISDMRDLTEIKRVRERADMCRPIVDALFSLMQSIKDAGNSEYGTLALNAANYLLDDKEGFNAFLTCGLMEISNNAIERCFRHLALGRRNWLQCGSHEAAEHTAFMYSLVESCRMNRIDFGDYIEHVLREIRDGNQDYRSLLPNHIILPEKGRQTKIA